MYLSTISIASYIINLIFIILFIRTFRKVTFPQLWQMAKQKVKTILRIKSEIEKAEDEGKKPFYFRKGTIVIYAKTQARAIYDYNEIKKAEKIQEKKKKHSKNAS